MNWKLKCLAFYALDSAPIGDRIYRMLQRKVTGRYCQEITDELLAAYSYHIDNFLRLPAPMESDAMEFGAGRNLLTPLLLSAAGAREVHVFDIDRLATTEQVNQVIQQLSSRNHPIVKGDWREIQDLDEDLMRLYRIRYCAPADARDTRLPTGSIDFICSTSTLEHIKRDDISSILAESQRICTPNGLLSFIIDYHDHYATADHEITRFNFYRYSERSWCWFNPPNHFQNRMRHSDYELLFDESGLTALEHRSVIPTEDFKYLDNMPMSKAFSHYSSEDLLALNGFFLLNVNQSEVN